MSAGDTRRNPPREALIGFVLPFLVAFVLLFFLGRNDLDGRLVDPYFDFAQGRWPLGHNFWIDDVLHSGAAIVVFLVALCGLSVAILGRFQPGLQPASRAGLYLALCIAMTALLAGILKSFSPVPCPWDSLRFGHDIPHCSPFASPAPGIRRGHCWPGAHAGGGFCFMAFYYILREQSLLWAWVAMALGWLIGHVYGWDQMVRGAHYPSHNVWASILAWTVCSCFYWGIFRGRLWSRPPQASVPSP